jgi:NADH-quinone oxidoreductase subunit I
MSTSIQTISVKDYFKNIFQTIRSVFIGLKITMKYVLFKKHVTIQYPEEREELPARARMRLYNDALNCISCTNCAIVCPVDCIYISSVQRPKDQEIPKTSDGTPIRKVLTQFVIDTSLCCYCGLCTTVCPTDCLTHSHDYEFSQYQLDNFKYDYLKPEVIAWRNRIVAPDRLINDNKDFDHLIKTK